MIESPRNKRQVIVPSERRAYASLVREFCRGAITNDEYDDRLDDLKTCDSAVWKIHSELIWLLYDDLSEHRLSGTHKLNRETRRHVARSLLFLDTSFAGDTWQSRWDFVRCVAGLAAIAACILAIPVLFFVPLVTQLVVGSVLIALVLSAFVLPQLESESTEPQNHAWPFLSTHDLADARRSPRLLAGVSTA